MRTLQCHIRLYDVNNTPPTGTGVRQGQRTNGAKSLSFIDDDNKEITEVTLPLVIVF